MSYVDELLRLTDELVKGTRASPVTKVGTVVDQISLTKAMVVFDGSGLAVPVKAFGDRVLVEGDRVGLVRLGVDWVVVGSFRTDWYTWPVAPVWSSTGTAPSLGNGTLIGTVMRFGGTVHTYMRLIWGSTTTGGTGEWQFTIPYTPVNGTDMLTALLEDSSANADYPGAVRLQSSSPHVRRVGAHTTAGVIGGVTATHPFTWASGDVLMIRGTYNAGFSVA